MLPSAHTLAKTVAESLAKPLRREEWMSVVEFNTDNSVHSSFTVINNKCPLLVPATNRFSETGHTEVSLRA